MHQNRQVTAPWLLEAGRVTSAFALLQADNATGNFVKIAQRIPVRITVDADQPAAKRLRPGMSVVVSIDTREAQ